jgi:hypothetical protein
LDRFQIYLIKPTRYDDDGYPLQWWRSIIPSNSLACLTGIVEDALTRGALGDADADVHVIDEIHSHVAPARIVRAIRRKGGRGFIGLVGVQTNQFPRAMDLAREFRAAGLPVCIVASTSPAAWRCSSRCHPNSTKRSRSECRYSPARPRTGGSTKCCPMRSPASSSQSTTTSPTHRRSAARRSR